MLCWEARGPVLVALEWGGDFRRQKDLQQNDFSCVQCEAYM